MSADIPSLLSSLGRWELAEYVACGVVLIGVAGETVADLTKLIKNEKKRKIVELLSAVVLLVGLARELTSLMKASGLTGKIIEALNEKAIAAGHAAIAAEKDAELAQIEVARLQKEAASLRKDAEGERLARVQLQAAIAPRLLSDEQQKEITEACRPFATSDVRILVRGTLGNGLILGIQIKSALEKAGFAVEFQHYTGVWYELSVSGPPEHLDTAIALSSAVAKIAKMPIEGVIGILPAGSPVTIVVGERRTGVLPKITRPQPSR